jgi:arylsulfatase A
VRNLLRFCLTGTSNRTHWRRGRTSCEPLQRSERNGGFGVRKLNLHNMKALFCSLAIRMLSMVVGVAAFKMGNVQGAVAPAPRTNVVLILADDLGWKDLASYGSRFYETPNIDRLARDGMKFTQAYSACTVCSPTRAALLTGKYPARLHVTDWIPGLPPANPKLLVPDWTKYLPLNEKSLGREFKSAGYMTASIGKWHLGGEGHEPEKYGFDVNIAGSSAAQPPSYFAPYKIATLAEGSDREYLTDRLGDEAVRFIEQNKDRPFFVYLPHFAVHLPLQGKQALIQKYRGRLLPGEPQTNAVYAAMIESMDETVGVIRRKLDELKLTERTVIVFASDNGGRVPTTSNLPLRVGKGSCYEGGTRVPLIVSWPGVTRPGSVCETPVITMDLFPTLLEAAGITSGPDQRLDGISLKPLLAQTGTPGRDELFWHYPHHQHYQLGGTTPYGAIHKGDFKLIEFFDDMRVELYDLGKDIGEQRNLAAQMPAKVEELRRRLHEWRKEVGAQMPSRNPNYDPSKPEHDPAAPKRKSAPEAK